MTVYATADEWKDWTGKTTAPSDIDVRLRRASLDVDAELLSAVYDATDPYVVAALRDATCEQCDYLIVQGFTGGLPSGYRSTKIGSVQLDRGGGGTIDATAGGTKVPFSSVAFTILQTAGLTGQAPADDARSSGLVIW